MRISKIVAFVFGMLLSVSGQASDRAIMLDSSNYNIGVNILQPDPLLICYADKGSVSLSITLENLGSISQSDFYVGWYYNGDLHADSSWADTIQSGSIETIIFSEVNLPSDGSYDIVLWVSGSGYSNINDSVVVHVDVMSPFNVDVLSDTIVCENSHFMIDVPIGYSSYQWSSGEQSNEKLVVSSGEFIVTVTDEDGCEAFDSIQILNYLAPGALLPGDTVLCDGQIFSINLGSGYTSYSWSDTLGGQSIDIITGGQYSVTVTDTNGCEYTDTIYVQGAATPQPGVNNHVTFCQGDSATLNALSTYSSYVWSTGDTSNSIVVTTSGNYIVTVVGAYGCIGIDTVDVVVNPLPSVMFGDSYMCNNQAFVLDIGWFTNIQWSTGDTNQSVIINSPGIYSVTVIDGSGCFTSDSVEVINTDVSIDLGSDTTICDGVPVFVILNDYDSYIWDDGDTSGTHVISASGIHSVTVTNGLCSDIDDIEIIVLLVPDVDFSNIITSPNVQFQNLSNVSVNLLWDFGDGTFSTALNPIHQYQGNGLFEVTLTASNMCGMDSISTDIGIYPQGSRNIYLNNNLSLFPTVSDGVINFKIEGLSVHDISYSVYDVTGKLILQKSEAYFGADHVYAFDVSHYTSGTYYLRIMSDSEVYVQPFIRK